MHCINTASLRNARLRIRVGSEVALVSALLACANFGAPAQASTESHTLVVQGASDLAQSQYDAALSLFQQAASADPADAEALFFQGAALDRLGRHSEALDVLGSAAKAGDTNPALGFELGWAQLATGDFAAAASTLENYVAAQPESAKAYELLGRAYLGAGEYDKADAAFQSVTAKDADLATAIQPYQTMLAQLRTKRTKQTTAMKKAISYGVDASIGFDSNVVALGNSIPPGGIATGKSSPFLQVDVHADTIVRQTKSGTIAAGYNLLTDLYRRISQNDTVDNYLYGEYARTLSPKMGLHVRLSDEHTTLGWASFRNEIELRPAVTQRNMANGEAEFAYTFTGDHYLFPATAPQTRTGNSSTLSYYQTDNPNAKLQLKGGVYYLWNTAAGSDWDYNTTGVEANAQYQFAHSLTGQLAYVYNNSPYKNNNSITFPAFKRKDHSDQVTLQVLHPVKQDINLYARWEYIRNHSNIPFYDYTQKISSIGVTAQY